MMNNRLSSKPAWLVAEETIKIMEVLNSGEGEARFVGGCVRDVLANRKSFDVDIAVNFSPEITIEKLKKHKIKFLTLGIKHGTITAIIEGVPFEITSLREDIETFGRHANVKFTDDWKTDAKRRDFTINAIFSNMEGQTKNMGIQ